MNRVRIGLIQMNVVDSKEENFRKAEEMIGQAVKQKAEIIVLPEMFNCPYSTKNFPKYAEKEGGLSWQQLSGFARKNRIFLVGGSIPEIDDQGKIYNTSFVFNPEGNQIAKHRKMHLFDIDIKGGQFFKESDTLTAGNTSTVFETPYGKIGMFVCYDLRFPELSRILVQKGAKIIIIPGAFNMTTGPAHWEILFRTRALDNQVYTVGCAPARNDQADYVSYANSIIVDPWGKVVNKLGAEENILVDDLDLDRIDTIRQELPLLRHLRKDVYSVTEQ